MSSVALTEWTQKWAPEIFSDENTHLDSDFQSYAFQNSIKQPIPSNLKQFPKSTLGGRRSRNSDTNPTKVTILVQFWPYNPIRCKVRNVFDWRKVGRMTYYVYFCNKHLKRIGMHQGLHFWMILKYFCFFCLSNWSQRPNEKLVPSIFT